MTGEVDGYMNEVHADHVTLATSPQHMYWNPNTLLTGVRTGNNNNPSAKVAEQEGLNFKYVHSLIPLIQLLGICLKE